MHNPVRWVDPTGLFAKTASNHDFKLTLVKSISAPASSGTYSLSITGAGLSTKTGQAIPPLIKLLAVILGAAGAAVYGHITQPSGRGSSNNALPTGTTTTTTQATATVGATDVTVSKATVLINSASAPGRGGVTPIGRAFQKHNSREGTVFTGQASGNAANNTRLGMEHLIQIIEHPGTTIVINSHSTHGKVLDMRMPCGKGARWSACGTHFIGFLEP